MIDSLKENDEIAFYDKMKNMDMDRINKIKELDQSQNNKY